MAAIQNCLAIGSLPIWTECKCMIDYGIRVVGLYYIAKNVWRVGRRFLYATAKEDPNERVCECLRKLTEDIQSVQGGLTLLLDDRPNIAQSIANMESCSPMTIAQLQRLISDHSTKVEAEVKAICVAHNQDLKVLYTERFGDEFNHQDGSKSLSTENPLKEALLPSQNDISRSNEVAESLQIKIQQLQIAVEHMQNEIGQIKEGEEQTATRLLNEATEPMQTEVRQLNETIEFLRTEIRRIEEAVEGMRNDIGPLKEAAEPIQTEIGQLKEETKPMQTEISLLKDASEPIQIEIKQLKEATECMQNDIKPLKEAAEPTQTEIKQLKETAEVMQNEIRQMKKANDRVQNEIKPLKEAAQPTKTDIKQLRESAKLVQNETRQIKESIKLVKTEIKPFKDVAGFLRTEIAPIQESIELVKTEMRLLKEEVKKYEVSILKVQVQIDKKYQENLKLKIDKLGDNFDGQLKDNYADTREIVMEFETKTKNRFADFEISTACKFEHELSPLEYQQEGIDLKDGGPIVFLWKISGFHAKLHSLIEEEKGITSEGHYDLKNGLLVKPALKCSPKSDHIFVQLEFVDRPGDTGEASSSPFLHYRKYVLLDQRVGSGKDHMSAVDRPLFGMLKAADTKLPYFSNSHLCSTCDLRDESKYLKNDQILIKIVLEPLDVACKGIEYDDGALLWNIEHYSKKKQDDLEDRTQCLTSEPFRTSSMGYNMQIELFLNHKGEDGLYFTARLKFILGENDKVLVCPIAGLWEFTLMDQSGAKSKCHMIKSCEFGIENILGCISDRRVDNIYLTNFVHHMVAEQPRFVKNDSILIKAKVVVY